MKIKKNSSKNLNISLLRQKRAMQIKERQRVASLAQLGVFRFFTISESGGKYLNRQMPLIYQYQNISIIYMSATKTFNGKYQDFQIALELNDAEVLQIQALNPKTKDLYSFAIDSTYLREHAQFVNTFDEPSDIFSEIEKNFQKVVFKGGKLAFPYTGFSPKTRQITIVLFRERALKALEAKLVQHQAQVVKQVQENNKIKENEIKELTDTVNKLSNEVKALEEKTKDLQRQIDQLKQGTIFVPDLSLEYKIALASNPGQVLDISGDPKYNNRMILWGFNKGNNQRWKFYSDNLGNLTFASFKQNLVMEIPEKESWIQGGARHDAKNQKWTMVKVSNGYSIRSVLNGKSIKFVGPLWSNENILVEPYDASQNNTWLILPFDS